MARCSLFCVAVGMLIISWHSPSMASGPGESVACMAEDAAFLVPHPDGWFNDAQTAAELGLCVMYLPQGETFHSPSAAVLYPSTGRRLQDEAGVPLAEVARRYAGQTAEKLAALPGGEGLKTREEIAPPKSDRQYTVWFFDHGPPPNEWEAVAYMSHNNAILLLVLSARNESVRDRALDTLHRVASDVFPMSLRSGTAGDGRN